MQPLQTNRLREIAAVRSITYETPSTDPDRIATRLSRECRIEGSRLYSLLSDPIMHQKLFGIILGSTIVSKEELGSVINDNQVLAVERVLEGSPGLALVLYTFSPPSKVTKDILTNPFGDKTAAGSVEPAHNKRGKVVFEIEPLEPSSSRLTLTAEFGGNLGDVFVRGLIDHIGLNFFENLMVEIGELRSDEKLTISPREGIGPNK